MSYVFINLGSNLGNRRLNLSKAMRAVSEEFGDFEMSHVVESEPWGFDSTHSFLNVGISFRTDLAPYEVLEKLQAIEESISPMSHRDIQGNYIDRVIDIDIVAIDRDIIDTPILKIPHPALVSREFFLKPMEELAPGWIHPITMQTPSEMLAELDKITKSNPE